MAEKTYKSYRQQLNILRSRGMDIGRGSQGSRVMRILERENYYNIINGYKELFLDSKATVASDIENTFKIVVAHEFSAQYGHDNYLKIENFDISSERHISSAIKLIGDI